jgi:hypothetical protein
LFSSNGKWDIELCRKHQAPDSPPFVVFAQGEAGYLFAVIHCKRTLIQKKLHLTARQHRSLLCNKKQFFTQNYTKIYY